MRISDWSSDVCSSDLVSASADDLSSLFVMPVGVVVPFFLPSAEVPTGWALCNGQTVARSDGSGNITTPDLRGRFLIGVSDTYALSSLGGEASASVSQSEDGAHSHEIGRASCKERVCQSG